MSGSIDQRVVDMRFNNGQFENAIKTTMGSLDKLKSGLDFKGSTKSLGELQDAGKNFNLSGIASAVDGISSKFGALGVIGLTTMVNLTNAAVNAGARIVKSLTIEPISEGFRDYNEKLTSVQTIMNATGSSLPVVDGYFKQLDTYADKTVYNLTDMTGAFAKFTNAGVDMDKSVPAIKGIANMVALAGQGAGAASIAMYNLSQSIAGGFLTTTDYKSLNLANVATKEWKEQMVAGAVAAGTLKKGAGDAYTIAGSTSDKAYTTAALFNEALAEGWASTDVLTKVLGDYGDTTTDIGKKAQAAAQDVKSLPMMMDTLKASVGTGWTDTFEILLGNVEESKELFTGLTNTIGGVLDAMSNARNSILGDWKALGGRTALIESAINVFHGLSAVVKPIGQAFKDIFPPATGAQLFKITEVIQNLSEKFVVTEKTASNIERTFRGVFAVLDIGWMAVKAVATVFGDLLSKILPAGDGLLGFTGNMGDFAVKARDAIEAGGFFEKSIENIGKVVDVALGIFKNLGGIVGDAIDAISGVDTSGLGGFIDKLQIRFAGLGDIEEFVGRFFEGIGDILGRALSFLKPLGEGVAAVFGWISDEFTEFLGNTDFNGFMDILNAGLISGILAMVLKFVSGLKKADGEGGGLLDGIKSLFGGVTDSLKAMQETLRAGTILAIAGALALLTLSIVALSMIDSEDLAKALGAIGVMMVQLFGSMGVFEKIMAGKGFAGMGKVVGGMILLAIAIRILASSVKVLSQLSWEELAKGLLGVTALVAVVTASAKILSTNSGAMMKGGGSLILFAVAIKILASVVEDLGALDTAALTKGLIGIGVLVVGLAAFLRVAKLDETGLRSGVGLILLGVALKILASAVADFGALPINSIIKGLGAMGVTLGLVAAFTKVTGKSTNVISTAIGLAILGGAMHIFAGAIGKMGAMDIATIGNGLGTMAGALLIVAGAMHLMPKNMIVSAVSLVIVAGALTLLADVLQQLGGMSMEEIGKALGTLAGGLLIIAGAMALMSGALPGAAALLVISVSLAILVPLLQAMGEMKMGEIGKALLMLAGAFVVLAAGGALLGLVSPALLLAGVGLALMGAGALMAGAGIMAVAIALTMFAAAGAAGAAALVVIVTAMLGLIPYALTQLGLGIIALAGVIEQGAPAIVAALVAVLLSLIDAIVTIAPEIIGALVKLVFMLVDTLVENVPKLVDAGLKLLLGILRGIRDNIGDIVKVAGEIIVNFLNGIADQLPKIVAAGANLIVTFVESIADAIRTEGPRLSSAALDIAEAIIDGVVGGITDGIGRVTSAAKNMASDALDAAMDFLGIASPSKEFHKLGVYSAQGYAGGMDDSSGLVEKSAENLGSSAMDTLRAAMLEIVTKMNEEGIDMNPTIRPVLDLSDIRAGANGISGLFGDTNLGISASASRSAAIAAGLREQELVGSTSSGSTGGNSLQFTQNNYSPKALTRDEIYRNTNNQISAAKGALVGK